MFRLLRYFSIASFVSMAAAAVVLGILHQFFETSHLLRYGESRNIALTEAFANNVWPRYLSFANAAKQLDEDALRHHPDITKLDQSVREAVRNTSTLRVQIYQLDGRTLFSTDAAQIGTSKAGDSGFLSARQGVIQNEVTHFDKFSGLDGEFADREVLASYIPLRRSADAPIQAVMAIYSDITDLEASDRKEETLINMSVVAVLTALYGILFFIVRHADSIIRDQYQKQRSIEKNLRHVTTHDALTNLPNRLLLLDRINQSLTSAERRNSLLAVAFINLDHFQNINNSLGHEIGDRVLQTVAQRLEQCVRESDTIARIDGDEFVASLPDIHSSIDLFQIAQKILTSVAAPIEMAGRELHLTASIGIACIPSMEKMPRR